MIDMNDFLVDEADDIIINGDILSDTIGDVSVMNTIERRVVGRWDDFTFDDIVAGLERFLFQTKNIITTENIRTAISDCLTTDRLLDASEFSIIIPDSNSRIMQVYLKLTSLFLIDQPEFKIIIDIENQRIYRG